VKKILLQLDIINLISDNAENRR